MSKTRKKQLLLDSNMKMSLIYCFVIMLVCFLFTVNLYEFQYLNYDDTPVFLDNARLHVQSLSEIVSLIIPQAQQGVVEYMPLKDMSLALDYYLFGLQSPLVRFQSFLWYGLSIVFCFLFVRLLIRQYSLQKKLPISGDHASFVAFLLAIAFLFHPVHVNSWAWISSRKDLLCGCFTFLSLWSYYVHSIEANRKFLVLSLFAYFLALLSKPTAAFLPLVIVALDLLYLESNRVFTRENIRKLAGSFVFVLMTFLFAAFYYITVTAKGGPGVENVAENVIIPPYNLLPLWIVQLFAYLKMSFYPVGLNVIQMFEFPELLSVAFVRDVLLVLALLAAFIWGLFKNRLVAFGIFFFVVSLLPTMLTNPFHQYYATRYLYFGIFGFLLVPFALLLQYNALNKVALGVVTLFVTMLGLMSHNYSDCFASSENLWKCHIESQSDHWPAYKRLALTYLEQNKLEQAQANFALCKHFNPESMSCAIKQAETLFAILPPEQKQSAIKMMLELVAKDKTGAALRTLALMYLELGEKQKALDAYAKGMQGHAVHMSDILAYAEFLWFAGEKDLAYKNLDIVDSARKSWEPDTVEIRKRWQKESKADNK